MQTPMCPLTSPLHLTPSLAPSHTGSVWAHMCAHHVGLWTHGPPPWTPTKHTDSCHTSPCSCVSSTHTDSPPAAPLRAVSLWVVGCYGVLITQTPPPVCQCCPGLSHGWQSHCTHWHWCEPRAPWWGGITSMLGVTQCSGAGSWLSLAYLPGSVH